MKKSGHRYSYGRRQQQTAADVSSRPTSSLIDATCITGTQLRQTRLDCARILQIRLYCNLFIDHVDLNLALRDVVQDLYSTDPTQETCVVDHADFTAPTRQHELDHTDRNLVELTYICRSRSEDR